jgi:hypothetical protein
MPVASCGRCPCARRRTQDYYCWLLPALIPLCAVTATFPFCSGPSRRRLEISSLARGFPSSNWEVYLTPGRPLYSSLPQVYYFLWCLALIQRTCSSLQCRTPHYLFSFFTSPSLSAICIAYIYTINDLGQEALACNLGYRSVRSIAVIPSALPSRPGQTTRCVLSPPRRVSYILCHKIRNLSLLA